MKELLFLILFLLLLSAGYAGFVFAPWVPTRKKDRKRIIILVNKYLPSRDGTIYELGSGTGGITIALAQSVSRKVIGIELFFPLVVYARVKNLFKQSKARFIWKDFFRHDLSDASLIYLFGTPKPLAGKLQKVLEQQCQDGTIIISYVFPLTNWEPIEVHKPTEQDLSIYVYKMKTARDLRGRRAA